MTLDQHHKTSLLDKSAFVATLGATLSWGFYGLNVKYGLTDHISMSADTYNWTVGGLPEFFGAWFAASFPASVADELYIFKKNHCTPSKTIHPITTAIIYGGITATAGIIEELYTPFGGIQDEWDIARYATGFAIGLTSALFHKRKKEITSNEKASNSKLEELL